MNQYFCCNICQIYKIRGYTGLINSLPFSWNSNWARKISTPKSKEFKNYNIPIYKHLPIGAIWIFSQNHSEYYYDFNLLNFGMPTKSIFHHLFYLRALAVLIIANSTLQTPNSVIMLEWLDSAMFLLWNFENHCKRYDLPSLR